jgi:hypothetical protein
MSKVDTSFFSDDFNNYQVIDCKKTYYNNNMVLIGIFMIVEMIVFLLIAFLYFLLQSAMTADRYWPEIGHKPFVPSAFISRSIINFKEWE